MTADRCAHFEMVLSVDGPEINPCLCTRLTEHSSRTRLPGTSLSFADHPCLPHPFFSQVEIRRPARELEACRPSRTRSEITQPQTCRIVFCVRAPTTEPALTPPFIPIRDCLLSFWCMLRAQVVRLASRLSTQKRLRHVRCCIRRSAGHRSRCGCSQHFIPSGATSFSARSARLSADFCALEVAERRERGCTVEWRHVSHVDVHRTSMWGDTFCVS